MVTECTQGFQRAEDIRETFDQDSVVMSDYGSVVLIPGMNFTCDDANITEVMAVGMQLPRIRNSNNRNAVLMTLSVWKKKEGETNEGQIYKKEAAVNLTSARCNRCKESRSERVIRIHCQLPREEQLSVNRGEILGIETPQSRVAVFQLYSITEDSMLTNYIINTAYANSTVDLSADHIEQIDARPLLTVEVKRGIIIIY